MEFINLHTSVLDSVEFLTATDAQRSTWLCLYRYCAGQENGGRIEQARSWDGRFWLQVIRVSARVVTTPCPLWSWEGDALVLKFYNAGKEGEVQRLRSQAVNAAHARWHRKTNADAMPSGNADAMPSGNADAMPSGNAERKGKEGNGKEGNGKEDPPTPEAGETGGVRSKPKAERSRKPGSVVPDEQAAEMRDRMLEVGALMGRRTSTPWTAAEFEAFRAQRLDVCAPEDFTAQVEQLRPFYAARMPAEKDFRRRELLTLLRYWPGELDKARAWLRDNDDGVRKV